MVSIAHVVRSPALGRSIGSNLTMKAQIAYPMAPDRLVTPAAIPALECRMDTATPAYTIRVADCLDFLRGLPDGSIDVIVTDPAYSGMNQHLQLGRGRIIGKYSEAGTTNGKWFHEFHDEPNTYREFLRQCHRVMRDNRHIYIMFDSFSLLTLAPLVRETFSVKNLIVWDKMTIGMGHYFRRRHEHIVFASKGKRPIARHDIPDVWGIRRIHRAGYPTQKPVELFEMMLLGSAEPGFVVCDPFVGSGSSAIAALKNGCSFVGADIDQAAVDFATNRCAAFASQRRDIAQAQGNANEQLMLVLERYAQDSGERYAYSNAG